MSCFISSNEDRAMGWGLTNQPTLALNGNRTIKIFPTWGQRILAKMESTQSAKVWRKLYKGQSDQVGLQNWRLYMLLRNWGAYKWTSTEMPDACEAVFQRRPACLQQHYKGMREKWQKKNMWRHEQRRRVAMKELWLCWKAVNLLDSAKENPFTYSQLWLDRMEV